MKKNFKLRIVSLSFFCLCSFSVFAQMNQNPKNNNENKESVFSNTEHLEVDRQTQPSNVITTISLKENSPSINSQTTSINNKKPESTTNSEQNDITQSLIQGIQEQQTIIEAQNAKIEALEKMILELQKTIENK